MLRKLHIWEIIKNGHKSLYHEIDGYKGNVIVKFLLFDLSPLIVSLFFVFFSNFHYKLEEFSSDILSGLSLFSGLLFSLIVVIVDKAKARKGSLLSSKNEEEKNYLSKYLLYSEQLITQISLSIIYSFSIIILLVLTQIQIENIPIPINIILFLYFAGITLITYFSIQFFILILIIISGMYSVFINELDN